MAVGEFIVPITKQEMMELIRQVIRDELTLTIKTTDYYDGNGGTTVESDLAIRLGDEVISTDRISVYIRGE